MELLEVFKALSNETRMQIIQWLKDPEIHFPKPQNGDIQEDGVCVSDIHKKSWIVTIHSVPLPIHAAKRRVDKSKTHWAIYLL